MLLLILLIGEVIIGKRMLLASGSIVLLNHTWRLMWSLTPIFVALVAGVGIFFKCCFIQKEL